MKIPIVNHRRCQMDQVMRRSGVAPVRIKGTVGLRHVQSGAAEVRDQAADASPFSACYWGPWISVRLSYTAGRQARCLR